MRVLKKTMSLLITMSILLSLSIYAEGIQTGNIGNTSIESEKDAIIEHDATMEIKFLKTIGIIDEKIMNGYEPTDKVTRAEFSYMTAMMSGIPNGIDVPQEGTGFKDVEASHWAAPYIYAAVKAGIISGSNDGMFYPEQPILYEQAIKMLVSVLGYNLKAEVLGGYPTGYLLVAKSNDITLDMGMIGTEMKKADVARMVFNALDTPVLIQESFGDSNIKYASYSNRTLLSENFSIYKGEGLVNDNGITRLGGKSIINDKKVSIKDEDGTVSVFDKQEGFSVDSLLGYNVVYFYKEENQNENTLVYLYPDKSTNILEIDSEDIVEYSNNTYIYEDEAEEEEKALLSYENDVIYNGEAFLPSSNHDMIPLSGKVILIDYDNDEKYDVVMISDYKIVCVESKVSSTKLIVDKYSNMNNVTLEEKNTKIYNKDKEVTFDNIRKGDILSVAVSKSTGRDQIIRVFVSSDYTDGRVSEKTSDGKIYVGDKVYEFAYNLKNNSDVIDQIEIGKKYMFYLDINNRIAGMQEDLLAVDDYVFMKAIAAKSGIGSELEMKALTRDGTFQILTAKVNKLKVDGVSVKTASDVYRILGALNGTVSPQLLKIERNSEGLVTSIDSIIPNATSQSGELQLSKIDINKGAKYKSTSRLFSGIFSINDRSAVFVMPDADKMDDDELFSYKTASDLSDASYLYEAYNIDENGVAKAVILRGKAIPDIGNDEFVGVVEKKTTFVDENGEKRTRIYFVQKNAPNSMVVDKYGRLSTEGDVDGISAEELDKGDVVRYYVDSERNTLTYAIRHLDFSNIENQLGEASPNNPRLSNTDYGALLRFAYGDVISRNGTTIVVRLKGASQDLYFSTARANMTLCEVDKKGDIKISDGTVNNIIDYNTVNDWNQTSKVIMRQRYGEVMDMVIYNYEQ